MANLSDLFPAPTGGTTNVASTITYNPGLLSYPGTSAFLTLNDTGWSGNKVTVVGRFRIEPFVTSSFDYEYISTVMSTSGGRAAQILAFASDAADVGSRNKIRFTTSDSSSTTVCNFLSKKELVDGKYHTFLYSYDGDNGTATLMIDGEDGDDTTYTGRVAPTTGTLTTPTGFTIAGRFASTAFNTLAEFGFFGVDDQYLTNYFDFFDSNGYPIKQDETNWANSGWGSQPLVFNENGDWRNNVGSLGNATCYGANDDGIFIAPEPIASPVMNYQPAMMQYDGSTTYYTRNYSSTGATNAVAFVAQFQVPSFTGTSARLFSSVVSGGWGRLYVTVRPGDFATTSEQNRISFFVQNSSGTTICNVISESVVADGELHTVFFSFNGTSGTAVLVVDGAVEDDTSQASRVAPTSGTLSTGATTNVGIAADGGGGSKLAGSIGFLGYMDVSLTNYSDFMDSNGNPIKQDTTTWANSGWGSQPLFWNEAGEMSNNLGSAGNMTENGTIVVADQGSTFYGTLPNLIYKPSITRYQAGYSYEPLTLSEQVFTFVCRFRCEQFTDSNAYRCIFSSYGTGNQYRPLITVRDDTNAAAGSENKLLAAVANTSGTYICTLVSDVEVCDGKWHTILFSFDASTGVATLLVDGVDADDTGSSLRVAPTTGTLSTGSGNQNTVLGTLRTTLDRYFHGDISFIGFDEQYLTSMDGLVDSTGYPIQQDTTNWGNTMWGSQPLLWDDTGSCVYNQGSHNPMTIVGVVGPGNNQILK